MTSEIYTDSKGKTYSVSSSDEIARGGEGRIMNLPNVPTKVIKLYHAGRTVISQKQFQVLQKLPSDRFVIPSELIFQKGKIAGYAMEYIDKSYFPFSALLNKNFCRKNGYDVRFRQKVGQALIHALEEVHSHDFVIGDFNPFNILINNAGDLKFIDTDSWQTPAHQHSGIMPDEVRDFTDSGTINKKSDFFALAVLLFYLFTHAHPFKGIHPVYRSLRERVIHRLPIFAADKALSIPKCYAPIKNDELMQQFEAIFIYGHRFLITLSGNMNLSTETVKPSVKVKETEQLLIRLILHEKAIKDVCFNESMGYIETTETFLIYKNPVNQKPVLWTKLSKKNVDRVFLSETKLLLSKNNQLFYMNSKAEKKALTNVQIPPESFQIQIGSVLHIVTENNLFRLYTEEIMGKNIRSERDLVHGRSFSSPGALIQNAGGLSRIFMPLGQHASAYKLKYRPLQAHQSGPVALIQYKEHNQITQQLIAAKGLQTISNRETEAQFTHFAYKPNSKDSGLIFLPDNEKIRVKRRKDFAEIMQLKCTEVSENSRLFYTNSGLIVHDDENVFLLNMK